jgi:hypothetical protein
MGVSLGLAGADLLGTMLHDHPDNLDGALVAWTERLRPFIDHHQREAFRKRVFFNPTGRREIIQRTMMTRGSQLPVLRGLLERMRLKDRRIAAVDVAAS